MKLVRLALAVFAALTATSALAAPNWLTVVDTAGGGHRIGNPSAKVKLTEFVSYTCPHCGQFAKEGANAVDLYVASGKVQADVRHDEFGDGVVTDLEEDRLTVLFQDVGYRTLSREVVAEQGLLEIVEE